MPPPERFKGRLLSDGRIESVDAESKDVPELPEEEFDLAWHLGAVIDAYLKAVTQLAESKYAHIKDWIPRHLIDPGEVLCLVCSDGLLIRFKSKAERPGVIAACTQQSLKEVAPAISQSLVRCYTDRNVDNVPPPEGLTMTLRIEADGVTKHTITVKPSFDVVIERPTQLRMPPNKPYCLLSITSDIEFHFHLRRDVPLSSGQRDVLVRSPIRLPVEWDCIEVYPAIDRDHWKAEYTTLWAENDILAAVVAKQFKEQQFQSLDPKASARRTWAALLQKYKDLLESNPEREEILQSFLKEYPALLCQTQVRVWPKLPLGARETDFVFREAAGDYLLVELEKSTHRLFLADGHTSREVNHARGQIQDWKRYLEDNLSTVQRELGLEGISANPKSLVVIGRSASLTEENRRKLVTIENESPRLKIMTYDDVYDSAKAVVENLLGPISDFGGNTQVYYF